MMIKKMILPAFFLMLLTIGCQQRDANKTISDGLYLITKIDTIASELSPLSLNEKEIFFSEMFEAYNSEAYLRIIVDTTQYVPLELEDAPRAEQQTETKKKLLLTLTNVASEKLKTFTANHVMDRVVLIVDGEALTMHKIREAITSGQLQISRCNDNACERLFVKLKDNESAAP
jgi:preprotein translocase subunit SecD